MSKRPDTAAVLVRLSIAVRARIDAEKALRKYWMDQYPPDDGEAPLSHPTWHKFGTCWKDYAKDEHDTDACCPVCAGSRPLWEARKTARRRAAAAIRSAVAVGVRLGKDTTPCR